MMMVDILLSIKVKLKNILNKRNSSKTKSFYINK